MRDLIAMRSGLYDYTDDKAFFDRYLAEPTLPWTDDDTLAIIRAHAADSTRRTRRRSTTTRTTCSSAT